MVEAPMLIERQAIVSEAEAYITNLQSEMIGTCACKKLPVAAFVSEKLEPALQAISSEQNMASRVLRSMQDSSGI